MIKNVIFDIGNVLVGFDWQNYLHAFHYDPQAEQAIANALFRSPLWAELDRGTIPFEELREKFAATAPEYREEILTVFDHAHRCIQKRNYAKPWLLFLKEQGFRVYYLSNYSLTMVERTRDALDFLPLMDGGLFSYEVQQIKPEASIFASFLARHPEVIPEESVFFDDSSANVEAAQKLGLHGIVFLTQEQAEHELERLVKQNN